MNTKQPLSNNAQNIHLESIKQIFLEVKICNPTTKVLISLV